MFVVMNRIPVNPEYKAQFEERFTNRAREVDKMPGFVRNQVLRPANADDPYIVLTVWQSKADFETWVNSEALPNVPLFPNTLSEVLRCLSL